MALDVYRRKRKFALTPEPRGRKRGRRGHAFVIQKHAARRLHYDLRLELDGVMKSWAVTRGPSLVPDEKRLAVHVEDHPVEYNAFEGVIPKGEYGGGTVMIWDRGTWAPDGDVHKAYAKGHLTFDLAGEKLKGRWHLVRMRRKENDRNENWLLFKAKDAAARGPKEPDILEEMPLSVVSGRSISQIAGGQSRVWHSGRSSGGNGASPVQRGARASAVNDGKQAFGKKAKKTSKKTSKKETKRRRGRAAVASAAVLRERKPAGPLPPGFVPPSLATLRQSAPTGANWIHEIKFDGYRIQARLAGGSATLRTRKGLDWTAKFREIADAVGAIDADNALLDGEIVVEDAGGISEFSALQADLKSGRHDRFVYYVFDLLHLNGRDLARLPLIERKLALQKLIGSSRGAAGRLRYSEHFTDDGQLIFKHACRMKLEGVVSKRVDAPYRSGRSENFVKAKCSNRQEFVVTGFTPSKAAPRAIGALTVAYYVGGELRYAGRVGTGFTTAMAHDLWKRLNTITMSGAPVRVPASEKRNNAIWVEPRMAIEAEFRGWTADGLLRQASFKGIREDKPAAEIVRESPADRQSEPRARTMRKRNAGKSARNTAPALSRAVAARKASAIGGVRLTHPDRVYWVEVGVTKRQLAEYYESIWDWIAPHVTGRALALVRCPEGTTGECFFQKHIPGNVRQSRLRHRVGGKDKDVIAVETLDDLLSAVQSGALEIHARGSRLDDLERCDRIVFDIDPGEGVPWSQTLEAAREVRDRLAQVRLESFVKLSGGKGLHVVLPIVPSAWEPVKAFAHALALAMEADAPSRYVSKMTKSLRKGRIFVDYLRNTREATSVVAYSSRARAGAPVSVPVAWQELGRTKNAAQYSVVNLRHRLGRLSADPWEGLGALRQRLPVLG